MKRCYYSDSIEDFLIADENAIVGQLVLNNEFPTEPTQRDAWQFQIHFLKDSLRERKGHIYFEYAIPRMGRRIDAVVVDANVIFVIEFKVGQSEFLTADLDQVWDYALDLKNFHETSHEHIIAPILIPTSAKSVNEQFFDLSTDQLFKPIKATLENFGAVYKSVLTTATGDDVNHDTWVVGRYSPTPTIIEAATALYRKHSVDNISRKDASAKNLRTTSLAVSQFQLFQAQWNGTGNFAIFVVLSAAL